LLKFYRGHAIIMLVDQVLTAEVTELGTRAPFPTKVTATMGEGERILMDRARRLVDLYLGCKNAGFAADLQLLQLE
jgi:hypothetical protein